MWISGLSLQVTDELLEKIASRSQNITEINISDCRNVSDTGVRILAIKCPGLLKYTAYRCKQLSDTSIIAVASQCPLLQKVHVGNQDRLTDEGLKQVTIYSTNLFCKFSIFELPLKWRKGHGRRYRLLGLKWNHMTSSTLKICLWIYFSGCSK